MKQVLYWMMVVWVCGVVTGGGTEPVRVTFDTFDEFAAGKNRGTSLSETGFLERGPEVRELAGIKADQIWRILPEEQGSVLVATSPEGRLYRVLSGGQVVELHQFEGTHLYAMARGPKGELFVAPSPEGRIYRVPAQGPPVLHFETGEKYVWDMAFDRAGQLYAATGTEGRVYRITGQGKGEVLFDSDEVHVRCLAFDVAGQLWAGSANTGLVYRISPRGQGVVMASTGAQEVNRLAVSPATGAIYFSAIGKARPAAPERTPSGVAAAAAGLPALMPPSPAGADGAGSNNEAAARARLAAMAASGRRVQADVSQLWKLDSTGFAEPVWGTQEVIQAVVARDDGVYVSTSGKGHVLRVDERGRGHLLLRVVGSTVSDLVWPDSAKGSRWLMGMSGPAAVLEAVTSSRAGSARYETEVIDSGLFARWGAVRAIGEGRFVLRTRSGNTPEPDKSWHPWVGLDGEQSASPAARFVQVEVAIESGAVDRLELVYLPRNVAPKVEVIEVLSPGLGYELIQPPPTLPQPKMMGQLLQEGSSPAGNSLGGGGSGDAGANSRVRFQPIEGRGLRTVTWRASDVNRDELRFTLSYRSTKEKEWRVLDTGIAESVWSWDTSGWPDGAYVLKVSATDAKSNAPGDALTDELESKAFVIDNTPPKIRVLGSSGGKVRFEVSDEASGLRAVTVSHDGKKFVLLRPVDGILDSREERFEIEVKSGQLLFIRAEDEGGNVSSAQARG